MNLQFAKIFAVVYLVYAVVVFIYLIANPEGDYPMLITVTAWIMIIISMLLVGSIAKSKGRSVFRWRLLVFCTGPIGFIIALLATPIKQLEIKA